MAWTEERVELLKELWSQGLPSAEIAEKLGEVTRNAVIGKIYRLGLSKKSRKTGPADKPKKDRLPHGEDSEDADAKTRPGDGTETSPRAPAGTSGQSGLPEGTDSDGEDAETDTLNVRLVEEASPKLNLMQLTEKTCKWPIGDPSKTDFWFCGHPSEPGKPYCKPHNKIAAQPITSKRDRKIQRPQDLTAFSRRQ